MITTKKDFLEKYTSGQLGNKLRSWNDLDTLKSSDYRGPVSIRSRLLSWKTMYYVPQERLDAILAKEGRLRGFATEDLYYNESAPDHRLTIQGEYLNNHTRYLMYSREKLAMKDALALPLNQDILPWPGAELGAWRHESEGLLTEMLLRANMNANSYDDFQILRDEYPDHVIEFSCYDCELGSIPSRNTLIWEVRSY